MSHRTGVLMLATAVLVAGPASAQQPAAWTGAERTEHFTVHFRPGSRAEAQVDRLLSLIEGDLAHILQTLGLDAFAHRIDLYVYDDVPELQRETKVPAAGFSTTLTSHVPIEPDQTRVHELVHVVAEQFTEKHGPEKRNLFFAEGLANAVLGFVSGVHVDQVAAFHQRQGDLPALADIQALDDFYGWLGAHPRVGAYDIAGSWMRFLLDRSGAAAVRRYYTGTTCERAFGKPLAALEQEWHAHLDGVQLRPGTEMVLRERHGAAPVAVAGGEASDGNASDADWHPLGLADLRQGDPARARGEAIEVAGAANDGDWTVARFGDERGDGAARATIAPRGGCFGVRLDLGARCQLLLLKGQGVFAYVDGDCVGHRPGVDLPADGARLELRRSGARASMWIDGVKVLDADVGRDRARIGVGGVGGPVRVRDLACRD